MMTVLTKTDISRSPWFILALLLLVNGLVWFGAITLSQPGAQPVSGIETSGVMG